MSIKYQYEIVRVDAAAKCMEIVYTADGHQTIHMSTRLPHAEEPIEAVIRQYEPVSLWLEMKAEVQVPEVGYKGEIDPTIRVQEEEETKPSAEIPVTFLGGDNG